MSPEHFPLEHTIYSRFKVPSTFTTVLIHYVLSGNQVKDHKALNRIFNIFMRS